MFIFWDRITKSDKKNLELYQVHAKLSMSKCPNTFILYTIDE